MAMTFFVALILTIYHQLVTPCCRITPDHRYFGYSYYLIDGVRNSAYIISIGIDIVVSVCSGISYIALIAFVMKRVRAHNAASRKEIRCFIQFFLMFVSYAIVWVTFFSFPAIDPRNGSQITEDETIIHKYDLSTYAAYFGKIYCDTNQG
ncbi:unnamed protein product [Strongylus vulgaris]|uniref:G-protein coupled receptors family 1 profile domain-containing protein n=1 Tax=Strongylus vulgaris TaxID=40348 RepID=A0A3P7ISF8_STRVU|nr:unnamed protein product [Strongylus vulgaris]